MDIGFLIPKAIQTINKRQIKNNPNINIYSTWGKGSNLKSWRIEIEKFTNLIKLVSPSKVARVPKGMVKFDYILNDWKNKINR